MKETKIQTGNILLAEPFSVDSHFKRTAVLLTEHHEGGTVGFILNKPMEIKIEELIIDFPEFDAPVNYGGPVATDSIHYVHNIGELLDDSLPVSDGIYWGGDYEKLKFLIDSKLVTPDNIRFYIGYSGWSSGQLDAELRRGSWVVADVHANYVFKENQTRLWSQIMENKGSVYSVIAGVPDSVNWN